MIEAKTVGPFVVAPLKVEAGLSLLPLIGTDDAAFQRQLLLKSVTRDGNSISDESFAEIVPHLVQLVEAAMEVNGFRQPDDE